MKKFTIERDNGQDIKFTGELLASAASSPEQAMGSSYSGSVGRWTELELYRTSTGKYICHCVQRTQWQGGRDTSEAVVCDDVSEVFDFFGYGWLAKELYYSAEIDASIDLDQDAQ
ncbi:hypothetical protein [Nitrosomonas sp. ANs5]|uniref:hypothetical protein n=1 Tax=Nitrosomonas sp. ANs5 TaxID=3423941 RepID=UPI003D35356E